MPLRIDNWQMAFSSELEKPRYFLWGKDDCCLFACDIIKAITKVDPAYSFRGKYKSALGAYREIRKQGFTGVMDVAEKRCAENNWPEIPILTAQRGDVVCALFNNQESLGIITGDSAAFVGGAGYVYIAPESALKAWRIG